MRHACITLYVRSRSPFWTLTDRAVRDETGEGVISAAIAVLIMAFLGVLMWVGFRATLGDAQSNVDDQVNQIGR
ncbi:MAG TPA: hypothetical protein VM030_08815 [Acidimicrobiales bacterium]|nr:hypothetical protein [Acidimicrobiales bacterium]